MVTRYWILLIALGAAFGFSFALNEVLLATYGPLTVSMLRIGIGAVGCWIYVILSGRQALSLVGSLIGLFVFGIFQYAAPFALLPIAQQHITSSVAGIANAMTPIAVVIVSQLWVGGERATSPKIVGIAFGFAGMMVLTLTVSESGGSDPRFILVAVFAPLSYGIALNFVRRFHGLDPVVVTTWAMTGGALAIAPPALILEGVPALPDASTAAALFVLGIVLTTVAFLVMYAILPHVGATNLSLVTFVAPVSALLIGASVFGEHISASHIVGAALILLGLVAIDGRIFKAIRLPTLSPQPVGPHK